MNNPYYTQTLLLAEVDKNDRILRPVERWEAHKKGILHRGFTVIMTVGGKYILQLRKNPVFDRVWDVSFSSHPYYEGKTLTSDAVAIQKSVQREWNMSPDMVRQPPKLLGNIYYKAKDPNSECTEHEIDYIYVLDLQEMPKPNFDYCYGYEVVDPDFAVKNWVSEYQLAPWVHGMFREFRFLQINQGLR